MLFLIDERQRVQHTLIGMPVQGVPSEFGDLRVKLAITMPTQLSSEERDFVGRHFEPAKDGPLKGGAR